MIADGLTGQWDFGGFLTGNSIIQIPQGNLGGVGGTAPNGLVNNPIGVLGINGNQINSTSILPGNGGTGVTDTLSYFTPTYEGFTLGASYAPNDRKNVRGATNLNDSMHDLYVPTYTSQSGQRIYHYNVGLMYATGPWAWSLTYYGSQVDGLSKNFGGKKEGVAFYQTSGQYALVPGVNLQALVGYGDYKASTSNRIDGGVRGPGDSNKGWAEKRVFHIHHGFSDRQSGDGRAAPSPFCLWSGRGCLFYVCNFINTKYEFINTKNIFI